MIFRVNYSFNLGFRKVYIIFENAYASQSDAEQQERGAVGQENPHHSWQEQWEAPTPTSHTPAHSPMEKQPQRMKEREVGKSDWQTARISVLL